MKWRNLILILFALVLLMAIAYMVMLASGPEGNISVESSEIVETETGKQLALQLKNNTEYPYSDIRLTVGLTNDSDSVLSRASSQTEGLGPGQTVTVFLPLPSENFSGYKILSIATAEEIIKEE